MSYFMKNQKHIVFKTCLIIFTMFFCYEVSYAKDLMAGVLSGDVEDTFGSSGAFWKVFLLIDVIVASTLGLTTRSYKVFLGVFFILLVPGFLVDQFVFN